MFSKPEVAPLIFNVDENSFFIDVEDADDIKSTAP